MSEPDNAARDPKASAVERTKNDPPGEQAPGAKQSAGAPSSGETSSGEGSSEASKVDAAGGESSKPDDAGSERSGEPAELPRKKKKKKKKKAEADEPSEPRQELDEEGRERPAFVLDFPKHPELDRLVKAFELGNYAYVRERARDLSDDADEDRAVRLAAAELLRRIEPDPLVKGLLALSVILLLVITFWAYRTHGP
jgi:hypothetical protein